MTSLLDKTGRKFSFDDEPPVLILGDSERLACLLSDRDVLASPDPLVRDAINRAVSALEEVSERLGKRGGLGLVLDSASAGNGRGLIPVVPDMGVSLGIDEQAFSNLKAKIMDEASQKLMAMLPSLTKSLDVALAERAGGRPMRLLNIPLLGGNCVSTSMVGIQFMWNSPGVRIEAGQQFRIAATYVRHVKGIIKDLIINAPDYVGNIEFQCGDQVMFNGSIAVLKKYKGNVMRTQAIGLSPVMPLILSGMNFRDAPVDILEADLVLEVIKDEADERNERRYQP